MHSWTVIPPAFTLSRSVEVLLAIGQTIYVVDSTEAEDRVLPNGPFKYVSVSPNGLYVTLYTEDGKVWVITSDFQNMIGEYESKAKTIPKDVQWCGNDSVLLAWEDEVHMIGPNGAVLKRVPSLPPPAGAVQAAALTDSVTDTTMTDGFTYWLMWTEYG